MKVFLNDTISESARNRLKQYVEIVDNYDHPEELDAIIVRQQYCTRDVISRAKKCRIIQQHGTGLDRIDLEAAKESGIPVYNTPGMNAQSVAEQAILLMQWNETEKQWSIMCSAYWESKAEEIWR